MKLVLEATNHKLERKSIRHKLMAGGEVVWAGAILVGPHASSFSFFCVLVGLSHSPHGTTQLASLHTKNAHQAVQVAPSFLLSLYFSLLYTYTHTPSFIF